MTMTTTTRDNLLYSILLTLYRLDPRTRTKSRRRRREASARLGCPLSRAKKAALLDLDTALRSELAEVEASERTNSSEIWFVVRVDGITNDKIIDGPFPTVRAASASHWIGRHWGIRNAEELGWQGPIQRTAV